MNITKIKLENYGFKGMTVSYVDPYNKDGKPFIGEVDESFSHPTHHGIDNLFKSLRPHLLSMCGYKFSDKELKNEVNSVYVNQIKIDSDSFTILGNKEIMDGKRLALNPPKCEADKDDYRDYEAVMDILSEIVDETRKYMAGEVKVTDQEIVERLVIAGKAGEMTMDRLQSMSDDEKKEFYKEQLESIYGALVVMGDDYEVDKNNLSEVATVPASPESVEISDVTESVTF